MWMTYCARAAKASCHVRAGLAQRRERGQATDEEVATVTEVYGNMTQVAMTLPAEVSVPFCFV